jgi:hypothetical protein
MLVSMMALSWGWLIYREDQRYTNICIDSMIEKIEELEAAAEEGQNNG